MEKGREYSYLTILIIFLLGFLTYYFINVGFKEKFPSFIIASVFVLFCLLAYRKNLYLLTLVIASSVSMFIALGVSFSSPYLGDSPIHLKIVLSVWQIFFITLISTVLVSIWYEKSKYKNKFELILFVYYVILWIILSINVTNFDDWRLENYLTVPFLIILFITFKRFRLSNISYTLIFAYMVLHIIGTHYTYSEVPFGYWLAGQFDVTRNHYDRIVHFSFGLLLAYPIREIAVRIAKLKGVWSLYFPIDFVLAFSAIYELIEWATVATSDAALGVAYLGSQGDIWDAQKDMFLAGTGSVIAMIITAIIIWYLNSPGFIKEIRESMRVKKSTLLGENYIKKYLVVKKKSKVKFNK
ncbi:MAG: DUF2238 domain-containing protein [Candidatus Pacearchaeota archaeon]|jgi:putative membrane protein